MNASDAIAPDTHQIVTILRDAMVSSDQEPTPINDEQLTLLATGRLHEIDPEKRDQLLKQVANSPDESLLLSRLHALNLSGGEQRTRRSTPLLRFTLGVWAVAACLMLGLFVTQFTAPTPVHPNSDLTPYHTPDQPDYWDQLNQQRLENQNEWLAIRDYALIFSTVSCVVLSFGIVILLVRGKKSGTKA